MSFLYQISPTHGEPEAFRPGFPNRLNDPSRQSLRLNGPLSEMRVKKTIAIEQISR